MNKKLYFLSLGLALVALSSLGAPTVRAIETEGGFETGGGTDVAAQYAKEVTALINALEERCKPIPAAKSSEVCADLPALKKGRLVPVVSRPKLVGRRDNQPRLAGYDVASRAIQVNETLWRSQPVHDAGLLLHEFCIASGLEEHDQYAVSAAMMVEIERVRPPCQCK